LDARPETNDAPPVRRAVMRPLTPALHFLAAVVPLTIRRSHLAKAAVVLVCALLLSYAWKHALFPESNAQTPLQDFAALPFAWPANLIPAPPLTQARSRRQFPSRSEQRRGNVLVVTDENGVRREIRTAPKNPLVRAMDHVVHPFRRSPYEPPSTAAVKVSEPSTN
jgi:hypothetical protein